MALLQNAMIIAGINPFWQLIVVGIVLLISVGLDQFARSARSSVTVPGRCDQSHEPTKRAGSGRTRGRD